MPKKLLLFLILFFTICSFSQNDRKNILGKVRSDSTAIKDVHIFNLTSRKGTISNTYGEFQIPVQKNDTLLISNVQYQVRQIIIDKTHLSNVQLLIYLKLKINELDEIEIKEHDLTGNLKNDATSVKNTNKMNKTLLGQDAWKVETDAIEDIDRINEEIDRMNREKAESARRLTDPTEQPNNIITYLMNLGAKTIYTQVSKIGQEKRLTKRERKVYEKKIEDAPDDIRNELGDSFFVHMLKIPPQNIDDFIIYCKSKGALDKYVTGNTIEAIDIIIKQSEAYLKELENEN